MFEELEAREPNHFAVRQYKKYSLAAGKTAKSILVSCGARLAPFDIAELREITMYDELELDTLGDKILFILFRFVCGFAFLLNRLLNTEQLADSYFKQATHSNEGIQFRNAIIALPFRYSLSGDSQCIAKSFL